MRGNMCRVVVRGAFGERWLPMYPEKRLIIAPRIQLFKYEKTSVLYSYVNRGIRDKDVRNRDERETTGKPKAESRCRWLVGVIRRLEWFDESSNNQPLHNQNLPHSDFIYNWGYKAGIIMIIISSTYRQTNGLDKILWYVRCELQQPAANIPPSCLETPFPRRRAGNPTTGPNCPLHMQGPTRSHNQKETWW